MVIKLSYSNKNLNCPNKLKSKTVILEKIVGGLVTSSVFGCVGVNQYTQDYTFCVHCPSYHENAEKRL